MTDEILEDELQYNPIFTEILVYTTEQFSQKINHKYQQEFYGIKEAIYCILLKNIENSRHMTESGVCPGVFITLCSVIIDVIL